MQTREEKNAEESLLNTPRRSRRDVETSNATPTRMWAFCCGRLDASMV